MDTAEGQACAARGGPHTGFLEEVIPQGNLEGAYSFHAEEQEKEFLQVSMSMQRLGETDEFWEVQ